MHELCGPLRDSAGWLEGIIAEGLQSKSPYMNARASAVRGLLEPDTDTGWLAEDIGRDSPWTLSVVGTTKERVAGERHARYWFRRFCSTTDMDEAWGAFRPFSSVVDRRCWIKHSIAEIHATSMKRLSKVEAADDAADGASEDDGAVQKEPEIIFPMKRRK
jgi:hypothetical protein